MERQTTHASQDLGNRFLRLPELSAYSSKQRDKRSDITFVVGILFYVLTGTPPKELSDHDGLTPNRRPLSSSLGVLPYPTQQLIHSVMDIGFRQKIDARFTNAADFRRALTIACMRTPSLQEFTALVRRALPQAPSRPIPDGRFSFVNIENFTREAPVEGWDEDFAAKILKDSDYSDEMFDYLWKKADMASIADQRALLFQFARNSPRSGIALESALSWLNGDPAREDRNTLLELLKAFPSNPALCGKALRVVERSLSAALLTVVVRQINPDATAFQSLRSWFERRIANRVERKFTWRERIDHEEEEYRIWKVLFERSEDYGSCIVLALKFVDELVSNHRSSKRTWFSSGQNDRDGVTNATIAADVLTPLVQTHPGNVQVLEAAKRVLAFDISDSSAYAMLSSLLRWHSDMELVKLAVRYVGSNSYRKYLLTDVVEAAPREGSVIELARRWLAEASSPERILSTLVKSNPANEEVLRIAREWLRKNPSSAGAGQVAEELRRIESKPA